MFNHMALLLGGKSISVGQGEFFLCTSGDPPIIVKSLLLVDGRLSINPVQKSLSGLTAIGDEGLFRAFYNCAGLTGPVSFTALTSIGSSGLERAFYNCTGLTGSVSFPALTSVGSYGLERAFFSCKGLTGTVSFPALTSIGEKGLYYAFYKCTGLTGSVSFPTLTSIESSGLVRAFYNCTGITEVHFKASLSGNSQCTASNMGCTNATVYFDL